MAEKNEGQKLVRYIAERMTAYMDMPVEHRKAIRRNRIKQRGSWLNLWFGMLPFAISQWIRSLKKFRRKNKIK